MKSHSEIPGTYSLQKYELIISQFWIHVDYRPLNQSSKRWNQPPFSFIRTGTHLGILMNEIKRICQRETRNPSKVGTYTSSHETTSEFQGDVWGFTRERRRERRDLETEHLNSTVPEGCKGRDRWVESH